MLTLLEIRRIIINKIAQVPLVEIVLSLAVEKFSSLAEFAPICYCEACETCSGNLVE